MIVDIVDRGLDPPIGDDMDDAKFEVQRARVRALYDLWIPRLRLQAWRFYFRWDRGRGGELPVGETAFECFSDWRYWHARIVCFVGSIVSESDDLLENMVVHELVHVHLSELRHSDSVYEAHEERVTEALARAFLDTYRMGKESQ